MELPPNTSNQASLGRTPISVGRQTMPASSIKERYNCIVRHAWHDQYLIESIDEAQDFATQWLWTYNNDCPTMGMRGFAAVQKLKWLRKFHDYTPLKMGRLPIAPRFVDVLLGNFGSKADDMSGSKFTNAFKRAAVFQVEDWGYTVREVVERLGVSAKLMYTWQKRFSRPAKMIKDVDAEMTQHAQLQIDTRLEIYFCDPQSPPSADSGCKSPAGCPLPGRTCLHVRQGATLACMCGLGHCLATRKQRKHQRAAAPVLSK